MTIHLLEFTEQPTSRADLLAANKSRNGGKIICEEKSCLKEITEKQARRDHIDNDSTNNSPENLRIICPSCNKKKDPPRIQNHVKQKGLNINSYSHIYTRKLNQQFLGTEAMKRNAKGKPKFRKWLLKKMKGTGPSGVLLLSDVIDAGAEVAKVEVETVEKWLRPLLSSEGLYEICDKGTGLRFNDKMKMKLFNKMLRGGTGDTSPDSQIKRN